jgi:hypothetical protein
MARAGTAGRAEVEQDYRLTRLGDNRDCGLFSEIAAYRRVVSALGHGAALPALSIVCLVNGSRGRSAGRPASCQPVPLLVATNLAGLTGRLAFDLADGSGRGPHFANSR